MQPRTITEMKSKLLIALASITRCKQNLRVIWKCAAAAFLFFGAAACASANVVTVGSSQDTTIYANNVNNSAGGAVVMFAGTDGNGSVKRALVKFDIASSVPAGSTITAVQLTLYLGQVAGNVTTGTATIGLHRLTASWGEGTNGANTLISADGQGFAAHNGDTTWANRFFSSTSPTPWTTAGGDFISAISAQTTVGATTNNGYIWLSTPALIADVQTWLDNPSTNSGWLLQNNDEVGLKTFRAFYTREETNSSLLPQLQVTFTPPIATPVLNMVTLGNGQLQLTASNLAAGLTNYLQVSTNLSSSAYWVSMQTNTAASNTMVFTGLSSTNAPAQLFRLVELPQQ
jgi:hypothetical protein